jgi:hypothetical protein
MKSKRPTGPQRERRRERAYAISKLKLFRSIVNQTMRDGKFQLFYRGFRVKPEDHIRVRREGDNYKLTFRNLKYSVLDRKDNQSDLLLLVNFINIDEYGNNLNPRDIMFSGYISQLGVGGNMPLDHNLNTAQ